MEELRSEVAFPKADRAIENKSESLYATALELAEIDLKKANEIINKLKFIHDELSIANIENKLKKVIIEELKELTAEPEGAYEEGHNGGIEQCISLIEKFDLIILLSKNE